MNLKLTRQEFERENADLFDSIVEPIMAALEDCQLGPSDIDEIVLVGGSTRIPRIRQIVGTFFGFLDYYLIFTFTNYHQKIAQLWSFTRIGGCDWRSRASGCCSQWMATAGCSNGTSLYETKKAYLQDDFGTIPLRKIELP